MLYINICECSVNSNVIQNKEKDLIPDLSDAERRLRLCEDVIDWIEKTVSLGEQPDVQGDDG